MSCPPSSPLPPYIARHIDLGFNTDDVAALIASIDSSQQKQSSPTPCLPAELLLQILEYVPLDYLLDWRLVCHGFRAAIDGRIMFHHLRRTQLIGYIGPNNVRPMERLSEDEYDRIHLLPARFHHVESSNGIIGVEPPRPVWDTNTHAIFQIEDIWFDAFRQIGGATAYGSDTLTDAGGRWHKILARLQLLLPEEGFSTLRWCIKLDHAVLDLAFPVELGRTPFDAAIDLHHRVVRVEWKPMLRLFLRTETTLRRMLDRKRHSSVTFSLTEDCLRAVRRARLHAGLDPDSQDDRRLKWSLRLLQPLFGIARPDTRFLLEDVEDDAVRLLLLLRREAGMTTRQIATLHQLLADFEAMEADMTTLDQAFREFKSHLAMPGFQLSVQLPGLSPRRISRNPFSWSDELLAKIEEQVGKWKSQRNVVAQMQMLLRASNMALTLPEDSFEDMGSDF